MNNERTPPSSEGSSRAGTLEELRAEIDRVDGALLEALVDRVRLAAEIGVHKGTHGAVVFDPGREAQIVRRACSDAREAGVPDEGGAGRVLGGIGLLSQGSRVGAPQSPDEGAGEVDGMTSRVRVAFQGEHGAFSEGGGAHSET